jgi:hypothetical protein
MNRSRLILAAVAGLSLITAGCRKNEKAASVSELENAFQLKKAGAQKSPPASPNDGTPQAQTEPIQQTVNQAVSALKTNGYTEAFVTLRSIQAAPGLTLDQYTAIINARLALEKDLAAKAVAGDPVAMRAVESIKRMAR